MAASATTLEIPELFEAIPEQVDQRTLLLAQRVSTEWRDKIQASHKLRKALFQQAETQEVQWLADSWPHARFHRVVVEVPLAATDDGIARLSDSDRSLQLLKHGPSGTRLNNDPLRRLKRVTFNKLLFGPHVSGPSRKDLREGQEMWQHYEIVYTRSLEIGNAGLRRRQRAIHSYNLCHNVAYSQSPELAPAEFRYCQEATYNSMFLTQPPVTEVTVELASILFHPSAVPGLPIEGSKECWKLTRQNIRIQQPDGVKMRHVFDSLLMGLDVQKIAKIADVRMSFTDIVEATKDGVEDVRRRTKELLDHQSSGSGSTI